MPHVTYKDSGTGVLDVSTGRLPILITGTNAFVEVHRASMVRVLAVSSETRSTTLPDVPTFRESGIDVSSATTTGTFGPPRAAPELVRRVHDAVTPMLSIPAVRDTIARQTMTVWPARPQQLPASPAGERRRFERLVKASRPSPGPGERSSCRLNEAPERPRGVAAPGQRPLKPPRASASRGAKHRSPNARSTSVSPPAVRSSRSSRCVQPRGSR